MNYVGIDIHKRYSVLTAIDGRGRELKQARIEGNEGLRPPPPNAVIASAVLSGVINVVLSVPAWACASDATSDCWK